MLNQFTENIFYHYILSDATLAMKIQPGFFNIKNLGVCYQYAKEHVIKYHEAPTATQLKEIIGGTEASSYITNDVIDIIYSYKDNVSQYTDDWLYKSVVSWAKFKTFEDSTKNMIGYFKMHQDDATIENADDIVNHAIGLFNQTCTVNFGDGDNAGADFWNAESHRQKKMKRHPSGYAYIDHCLKGGWFSGGLFVFVGQPKVGKSAWLQNLCAESVKRGENNAYVSLELSEELINMRIGANMFNISTSDYERVAEDVEFMGDTIKKFRQSCLVPPGALIVKQFPTSTLSTIELEAWLLKQEAELSTPDKPFKFKNVFVDYINIMANWRNPNSDSTYMKIKQIAEDLRAMGIKNGWAIITATQTNRTAFDATDMATNQVSESSALNATVDGMWGIIADAQMQVDGIYYLKCMLDRVAPEANTRKKFFIDSDHMRIVEDATTPIETVIPTLVNNPRPEVRHPRIQSQPQGEIPQGQVPISSSTGYSIGVDLINANTAPATQMPGVGDMYPKVTGTGIF